MLHLFSDLKHALRVLLKNPGFTATAVIVLALGIGANTAIFSVVNAVLLRPLPFRDPARLVQVWHVPPPKSFPGMTEFAVSAANFIDWQKENNAFDKMTIYKSSALSLTGREQPEELQGAAVSSYFFATLQAHPWLGRTFTADEDQPGKNHVIILSYGLWKSKFAGNPNIVGHNVKLNGEPYLVAGVMDAKFRFPDFAQYWKPMGWTDKEAAVRGEDHYQVVARLKPGSNLMQAQAEMNTISSRLAEQYPEDDKGWGAIVVPLREEMFAQVRPSLLILLGAVAFVLLIACANVANLALAKTLGRRKEVAIRVALGATAGRIVQQILAETVLLSLAGGALGLTLAHFGIQLTVKFLADNLPKSTDVNLDAGVLFFTLALAIATGLLSGLLPALRLTKTNVNDAIKQGLGKTDSDSSGGRTRSILVISPVAIEGQPALAMSDQPEVDTRTISPGFLSALRISLLRGREFYAADTADRPAVAVISESMAKRFWPNEDPIGKHLTMSFFPGKVREIIGIVRDVKLTGLDAANSAATVYLPMAQTSTPLFGEWSAFSMQVAVRTASPPANLTSAVTAAIHSVDSDQPVVDVMTMDDLVDTSLSQRRFSMLLLAAFAVLALLLAAVGIYSVLSFAVRRRVREIGIRVALGAEVKDILRLIVAEGMKPALIGLFLGVAGALALGKVLASFIYGIAAYDPLTFAAVAALLAAIALLASIIPAYRAARIEPTRALREE
jgi:ABC-type antimicrobial peptide transport system permease subunit